MAKRNYLIYILITTVLLALSSMEAMNAFASDSLPVSKNSYTIVDADNCGGASFEEACNGFKVEADSDCTSYVRTNGDYVNPRRLKFEMMIESFESGYISIILTNSHTADLGSKSAFFRYPAKSDTLEGLGLKISKNGDGFDVSVDYIGHTLNAQTYVLKGVSLGQKFSVNFSHNAVSIGKTDISFPDDVYEKYLSNYYSSYFGIRTAASKNGKKTVFYFGRELNFQPPRASLNYSAKDLYDGLCACLESNFGGIKFGSTTQVETLVGASTSSFTSIVSRYRIDISGEDAPFSFKAYMPETTLYNTSWIAFVFGTRVAPCHYDANISATNTDYSHYNCMGIRFTKDNIYLDYNDNGAFTAGAKKCKFEGKSDDGIYTIEIRAEKIEISTTIDGQIAQVMMEIPEAIDSFLNRKSLYFGAKVYVPTIHTTIWLADRFRPGFSSSDNSIKFDCDNICISKEITTGEFKEKVKARLLWGDDEIDYTIKDEKGNEVALSEPVKRGYTVHIEGEPTVFTVTINPDIEMDFDFNVVFNEKAKEIDLYKDITCDDLCSLINCSVSGYEVAVWNGDKKLDVGDYVMDGCVLKIQSPDGKFDAIEYRINSIFKQQAGTGEAKGCSANQYSAIIAIISVIPLLVLTKYRRKMSYER